MIPEEGYWSQLDKINTVQTRTHLWALGTRISERLTSLGDERVGEGGFSVINVGDHRHVSDVSRIVHGLPNVGNREKHLGKGVC